MLLVESACRRWRGLLFEEAGTNIQCLYHAVIMLTVLNREYNFYSVTEPHYLVKRLLSFWFLLFFLPIVLFLSVAFLSQSCLISLCLATYITPSLQILLFQSLPFSFLSLSPHLPPSVSALFNQKLFQPVGSLSKYNAASSVTDTHASTLKTAQNSATFSQPL